MLHIFEIVFLMTIFRHVRQSHQAAFFFFFFFGMGLLFFAQKGVFNFRNKKKGWPDIIFISDLLIDWLINHWNNFNFLIFKLFLEA